MLQSTYFPEEAGLPFGDENSPKYLMMEVHYDNPQLLSGLTDNSGMSRTTSTLCAESMFRTFQISYSSVTSFRHTHP